MSENEFWGYDVAAARAKYSALSPAQKRRSKFWLVVVIACIVAVPYGCVMWLDEVVERSRERSNTEQWRARRARELSHVDPAGRNIP